MSEETLAALRRGEVLFDGTSGVTKPNPNYIDPVARRQKAEQEQAAKTELRNLEEWFDWYDKQVNQHARAVHLDKDWSANDGETEYTEIGTLHERADLIAAKNKRIKEQGGKRR